MGSIGDCQYKDKDYDNDDDNVNSIISRGVLGEGLKKILKSRVGFTVIWVFPERGYPYYGFYLNYLKYIISFHIRN